MSTAFSNPVVHACQPGWHGAPRVAAALSISPWVLAPRFPLRQVRCWMEEKCCVSSRDKGKMERRAGPFLLRGTEQTHTQSHHSCNVVLGRLRDSKMAPPPPPAHTHSLRTALAAHTSSSDGGQPIQGKRKEQGHSLLFHPRNCQASTPPQLATDPFLPVGLRHTPLC